MGARYAATSSRDAMVRAGVGQGSLEHDFRGKRDLAVEALSAVTSDVTGEASLSTGRDPRWSA